MARETSRAPAAAPFRRALVDIDAEHREPDRPYQRQRAQRFDDVRGAARVTAATPRSSVARSPSRRAPKRVRALPPFGLPEDPTATSFRNAARSEAPKSSLALLEDAEARPPGRSVRHHHQRSRRPWRGATAPNTRVPPVACATMRIPRCPLRGRVAIVPSLRRAQHGRVAQECARSPHPDACRAATQRASRRLAGRPSGRRPTRWDWDARTRKRQRTRSSWPRKPS